MMPIQFGPVEEGACLPPIDNTGIPRVARPTKCDAPVHIDVGGTIYTSTLETLTAFPDSRLAMMFNGTLTIILDALKQHYFIDRDGEMFRHILNYARYKQLMLPDNFGHLELLLNEAQYFGLDEMVADLTNLRRRTESSADAGGSELEVSVQAPDVKPEINVPTQDDQNQPKPSISIISTLDSRNTMNVTTEGELAQEVQASSQEDKNTLKLATPVHLFHECRPPLEFPQEN